jgi:hypothetical protein
MKKPGEDLFFHGGGKITKLRKIIFTDVTIVWYHTHNEKIKAGKRVSFSFSD